MRENAENSQVFKWFHKGLGLIYLTAFVPLFHQITPLIGENGMLPAKNLLSVSYKNQGTFLSFMQFPSLFHFFPYDATLYLLISAGTIGAFFLLFTKYTFYGALTSWISFLSITTIGGDFFVIIIDLFLAEVGFLAVFSTFFLSYYKSLPFIIRLAFLMLNFKLWFGMGMNKFYFPQESWFKFTFFNYFFHSQPMPTPVAKYFNNCPQFFQSLAIIALFVSEIIIPFFVFGKKRFRQIAFFTFTLISILIQLNGNYGFFNILSITLAITILKDADIPFIKLGFNNQNSTLIQPKNRFIYTILISHILIQAVHCLNLFNPNLPSPQNQFNFIFTHLQPKNKYLENALIPLKWIDYWRICNPYGVFRDIPRCHGEIRFSGSNDGIQWEDYEFRFLPSGKTDKLAFFAPYYPRLDHLLFYETLAAQNYKWNPLNPYYNESNPWICNFIDKLLQNNTDIDRLLSKNPFVNKQPPLFIKTEVYRLSFSKQTNVNWDEKPMKFIRIFDKNKICLQPVVSLEEAIKTTYSN